MPNKIVNAAYELSVADKKESISIIAKYVLIKLKNLVVQNFSTAVNNISYRAEIFIGVNSLTKNAQSIFTTSVTSELKIDLSNKCISKTDLLEIKAIQIILEELDEISKSMYFLYNMKDKIGPLQWDKNFVELNYKVHKNLHFLLNHTSKSQPQNSFTSKTYALSSKPRIVGVLQIKNCEKTIERILQSAVIVCDYIVIIDNLSTDSTRKLINQASIIYNKIILLDVLTMAESGVIVESLISTDSFIIRMDSDEIWDIDFSRKVKKFFNTKQIRKNVEKIILKNSFYNVVDVDLQNKSFKVSSLSDFSIIYAGSILDWKQPHERLHGEFVSIFDINKELDDNLRILKLAVPAEDNYPHIIHIPLIIITSKFENDLIFTGLNYKRKLESYAGNKTFMIPIKEQDLKMIQDIYLNHNKLLQSFI